MNATIASALRTTPDALELEIRQKHIRMARASVTFKGKIDDAKDELDKFAKKVLENPTHAMTWADSAYDAAAAYRVYSQVQELMSGDVTLANILDHAKHQLMHLARYPSRSSSCSSNMLAQAELVCWARVCERLESAITFLAANNIVEADPV